MAKVFVTDSTSFLNSYIGLYALELGLELKLGLQKNFSQHHIQMLEEIMKFYNFSYDVVEVDLEVENELEAVLEGCDAIIHSHLPDQEENQPPTDELIKRHVN